MIYIITKYSSDGTLVEERQECYSIKAVSIFTGKSMNTLSRWFKGGIVIYRGGCFKIECINNKPKRVKP
jgi:hypothetical protein